MCFRDFDLDEGAWARQFLPVFGEVPDDDAVAAVASAEAIGVTFGRAFDHDFARGADEAFVAGLAAAFLVGEEDLVAAFFF